MDVRIFKTEEEIGAAAGKMFCDFVNGKPDCVLGFATGATPVPTYTYMAEQCAEGKVSFEDVKTFNLDEYCDLPKEHKNSFYMFMYENLFSKVNLKAENIDFLNGNTDPEAESARYTKSIEDKGGIDIQLLGIGRNGHIAFNEPADEFSGEAYKIKLTESTIEANSIYFDDVAMPRYAMTMGIGSIMKARKIIFIATGASKAQAVHDMIKGEVTPKCPASILQNHADVTVFLDEAAAAML